MKIKKKRKKTNLYVLNKLGCLLCYNNNDIISKLKKSLHYLIIILVRILVCNN